MRKRHIFLFVRFAHSRMHAYVHPLMHPYAQVYFAVGAASGAPVGIDCSTVSTDSPVVSLRAPSRNASVGCSAFSRAFSAQLLSGSDVTLFVAAGATLDEAITALNAGTIAILQ